MIKMTHSKKRLLSFTLALQLFMFVGSPIVVLAEEAVTPAVDAGASTTETTTTEAPTPTAETPAPTTPAPTQGPTQPTGPEARTYVYNPATGRWENGLYSWDPVTKQTAPMTQKDYSYNPETGMWDTTEWLYVPEQGKYIANVVSVPEEQVPDDQVGAKTGSDEEEAAGTIGTTGPDSTNKINNDSLGSGSFNSFYNARISNSITARALTGNAAVTHNTLGGDALTGNASSMANIINLLQSAWNPANGNLMTFIANVEGDLHGDIVVDPGQINGSQLPVSHSGGNRDIALNVENNVNIDNDIDLSAHSGNATVDSNTTGGDATTGNALVVANLMNMINSTITAGDSFIGVLNVNGNFEGDVLLPENFVDQAIASNVPTTELDLTKLENSKLLADFTENQSITNNIDANAASGNANVTGNTTGGNATTGDAQTSVTLLNLTGRQVVGDNAILVFVNVMGEWVGMIMDAPGSNAAMLGGGVTENSCTTCLAGSNTSTDIDVTNNLTINNDLNLDATSGDANVTNNTTGGNATTGDASVFANVANITNSQFSFGGTMSVFFLNILGDWHGSFGVDTAFGDPAVAPKPPKGVGGSSEVFTGSQPPKVFSFVPSSSGNTGSGWGIAEASADVAEDVAAEAQEVLSSLVEDTAEVTEPIATTQNGNSYSWVLVVVGTSAAVAALAYGEKLVALAQGLRKQ